MAVGVRHGIVLHLCCISTMGDVMSIGWEVSAAVAKRSTMFNQSAACMGCRAAAQRQAIRQKAAELQAEDAKRQLQVTALHNHMIAPACGFVFSCAHHDSPPCVKRCCNLRHAGRGCLSTAAAEAEPDGQPAGGDHWAGQPA